MSATGYIGGYTHRESPTITICYYDGAPTPIRLAVPITQRSIRRFMLMQDDYIQLEFSLAEAVHISIGDYIEDEIFGTYYITEEQMPKYNTRTGGYDYSLRFDAPYMRWKQYIFMLMAENDEGELVRTETSWKLTAPLATHAEQVLNNITRLNFTGYSLSVTAEKAAEVRYLQYDGVNIIEALGMIAEAWECEWWVTGKIIHFGKCELDNTPFEFAIGENVESMDISRDQQTYANRIFAYGGTQNVPETYDKELIWQATTNGSSGFKDDNRPLTLDMIASAPSAVITSFFMAATASAVSTLNPKTYRQITSSASLNGEQHIAGLVQVAMTMESDDWAGIGYEPPTVGATLILHVGTTATTLNTQSALSPIGAFGGQTWPYSFNVDTFISPSSASTVYLEVLWTITFPQGSQHMSDTLTWDNSGTTLTATAAAGASTKAVNVALYGSDTTYPATFNGATGLISFDGSRPSGWGRNKYYTLSPLTLKVPISYYTRKYEVGMSAVGDRRIHLPGDTRFIQVDDLPARSIVELAVIFPDEFPRLDLRIKAGSIGTAQKTDTTTHDDGSVTREDWTQYSFAAEYSADGGQTWSDFTFKTEWIMDGEKLQAAFTTPSTIPASGFQLAGMTFDVGYDYGRFTIIRNDNYGAKIPNEYLIPHEGDTFFLTGWNPMAMAEMGLISASENRLRALAIAYLNAIKAGQFTFNCRMMSDIFWQYAYGGSSSTYGLLDLGAQVTIYDDALPNGEKTSRIIGYEYKLDIPFDTPTYIVGETEAYSRLKQIEKKLTKL